MIRHIFYFFTLFIILGCSNKKEFILFSQADINSDVNNSIILQGLDDVQFEYKIVPHDRVSVIVYENPHLSTSSSENRGQDVGILVNSKGDIRLPLVKSIKIAGLTQTEALDKIEGAFRKYLKSPDIYIEVLNKRAYVVGEVNRPGEIKLLNEQIPLMQLLSKAGDFKDSANKKSIMILRSGKDRIHSQLVDLTDFNSLRTASLMIHPNDIVYVLPNDMKAFNAKVNDVSPIFSLIGSILSPFITVKVLSSWGE